MGQCSGFSWQSSPLLVFSRHAVARVGEMLLMGGYGEVRA